MPENKRILVIDDDDFVRMMVIELLESFGYAVQGARDGIEGLDLLDGLHLPDVVLTDIVMPRKDGLETIREIHEKFPGVKIVAVSGGGRSEAGDYLEQARKSGATEIISKPINPKQLKEMLRRLTDQ